MVRSIRQRYLLNTWLRAAGKHRPLPLPADFQPDRVADEMVDMMEYEVVGQGDDARFLITHQGARLATTYGNERVDPADPPRFLDDAIGPERYANVIELYRACLRHVRPVYSISTVQDADGEEVCYKQLLIPVRAVQQQLCRHHSAPPRAREFEGSFSEQPHRPEAKAKRIILIKAMINNGLIFTRRCRMPTARTYPMSGC